LTDASAGAHALSGLRVIEYADELGEYCGLVLAGLGAEVIKVEPPGGSSTRRIGPFYEDVPDPERSLFFWAYNRGKKSIVADIDSGPDRATLLSLLAGSDIFLDSSPPGRMGGLGLGPEQLHERFPELIVARVTPFGEDGPWAGYRGSDLVHLALGGPMMNCGYSPQPDGHYDLPPMAPQAWHSYHIAGEQTVMAILGALVFRGQTGRGQVLTCSVHEAVAKNTELDLMNWVMRRAVLHRQTCAHAMEEVTAGSNLAYTKDGRWFMTSLIGARDRSNLVAFLERYGMSADLVDSGPAPSGARSIPGSGSGGNDTTLHTQDVLQRFVRRFTYETMPWREMQDAGIICVPIRRPGESLDDEHWIRRETLGQIEHPEIGRSFTYVTGKWRSSETRWAPGRRAPLLDEDRQELLEELVPGEPDVVGTPTRPGAASHWHQDRKSPRGRPAALDGIRVLDFTWFLASAGGTRFLSALGAECIKVEWATHPDTRMGAMAPLGGRQARRQASAALAGVSDPDMGGQFNNKNAGKRGLSLNVTHPAGLEIARRLVAVSDIVAEGFSPGVMERWGLGYNDLRAIRPDVIYAQQSGMGSFGTYGRFRAVGPIAAALAGTSEMSGLQSPALPAGWGYSYLDWIGAYSFAVAMLSALYHRDQTGRGQWVDASQCEAGIYLAGAAVLDRSANGRDWARYGNRSSFKPAAPHGAYPCAGDDRWVAIACFSEQDWAGLAGVAGRDEWLADPRFARLPDRLLHQDDLDAAIGAWTRTQDRYDLMHRLQALGIAAGVCQTAEDRCDTDPQLAHLEWLTEVTGTKIGTWPVAEVPVHMSATPPYIGGMIDRGAPCYGEDNEYVLGELLGYTTRQIRDLQADGVI
jgi:crotonobetainyl-CoA:carnitine CoA-transferase CaiB-like acyl-CoA transferase